MIINLSGTQFSWYLLLKIFSFSNTVSFIRADVQLVNCTQTVVSYLLIYHDSSLVWMMRMMMMMKIYQWRLRLSGRKCGGWQTTPANGYACGTSTRLLRSWAACVSSIWTMRNHKPNWSFCNRLLTLYSTWSSKFEVSGCPRRKEVEGKGIFTK